MATPSLFIGPAQTITQNIANALPARQVRIVSTVALEVSVDGSSWSALANSTTGTDVTGVFVRCTTASPLVVCRV